jgi:hypothetical protein
VQETKLLGTLLPSSPAFLPIIQRLRERYGLPEVGPHDDPIEELFLDGESEALEDFRGEIRGLVQEAPDLLPPAISKSLKDARAFVGRPLDAPWLPDLHIEQVGDSV